MSNLDNIIEPTIEWLKKGEMIAIATVISTWGSSPRQVGGQMAINQNSEIIGSVSGGCVENAVIAEALESIKDKKHRVKDYGISNNLAWEVGLACGGQLKILIQPLEKNDKIIFSMHNSIKNRKKLIIKNDCNTGKRKIISKSHNQLISVSHFDTKSQIFYHIIEPKPRLFIVGGVHLAQALSSFANLCDYEVIIIDPREHFASKNRFPNDIIINKWPDDAFERFKFNDSDIVVTLTHDPKIDDLALTKILRSNVGYIGCLGSKKTHQNRIDRLEKEGFKQSEIQRIHAPIGLDISSKTPQEISISILAEVIKFKRSFK